MIRKAVIRRDRLIELEEIWPEGSPFFKAKVLRAKPGKTVMAFDSAKGPVVAYFLSPEALDQRPEGVANAHRLLAERLGKDAVPALVAFLVEQGVVITEQVQGDTAAALIRRDAGSSTQAIHAAAGWLSRLHGLVDRPDGAHDFSGRVKATARVAPPAIAAEIERLSRDLRDQPVRHVKFHNDYKPDNVVIGPDRVCAIDFRNTRFRPPHVDAAQFLTRAAIYALSMRAPGPVNRIGLPLSVAEPFDAAYGRPISTEKLTELYVLTNIVLAEIKRAARPLPQRTLLDRKGQNGSGLRSLLALAEAALTPPNG